MNKTLLAGLLSLVSCAWAEVSVAEAPVNTVKIGVLTDMSGPYADPSGKGSVIAAQMAADDFAKELGPSAPKVVVVAGDHQNKADVGAAIARRWIDQEGVDAVADLQNSAVALAVNQIVKERDRTLLASSSATSELTGIQCAPTTVQWTFDTWALAHGTGRTVVKAGGNSWFFLASDFAFGKALVHDVGDVVKQAGGTVAGEVAIPIGTSDMSSYLLQAQASGAQVIGVATSGDDATNTLKQAAEFGIGHDGKQKLAGLLIFLSDIHSMGLQVAQGLIVTEAFYWDLNDATRAWSHRFASLDGGRMPTMNHAGVYSSVMAYLHAVVAANTTSGRAVVATMRKAPLNDPLFGPTSIRIDGRAIHTMYIFQVKKPSASTGEYDVYDLLATIPPEQAFRPLHDGGCPLVPAKD